MNNNSTSETGDIAVIGLAVMGANLSRNLERNGYKVVLYNRTTSVTEEFLAEFDGNFISSESIADMCAKLSRPRKMILMIKAGPAVDKVIDSLLPHLEEGDIIIDGGNTYFPDTNRREKYCNEKGIKYLGIGISGGEEGALNGASIMPGGNKEAWSQVSEMLDKISAKVNVDEDGNGEPCTGYVGPAGAGHFVKMVHNGIEYADMQLIAETYDILKRIGRFDNEKISEIFGKWNSGRLSSFLVDITTNIFKLKEDGSDQYVVDLILDKAGQKGTGRWTAITALELGCPVPTIAAAVDARSMSAKKDERVRAAEKFNTDWGVEGRVELSNIETLLENALYLGKILCYAQGMDLIKVASNEWSWNLNFAEIAAMWRGGCIIRAELLAPVSDAFKDGDIDNLIVHESTLKDIKLLHGSLRSICAVAQQHNIPVPAFSASLSYLDLYTSENLPLNLTQAQRDYFGAHTYVRTDNGKVEHTDWVGIFNQD